MNEEERMKKNEYSRKYRQTEKYKKYHKEYWLKHGAEINAKRRNRKAYKYRNEKATEYIKDYFYIDKETGEYIGYVELNNQDHVGGIAYDQDDNQHQ